MNQFKNVLLMLAALAMGMLGSNLSGAHLNGADLSYVNLTGANLTSARYMQSSPPTVTGVTYSNTTCPDRTNSNANSGTCSGHGMP